jgi:hypothetical protein
MALIVETSFNPHTVSESFDIRKLKFTLGLNYIETLGNPRFQRLRIRTLYACPKSCSKIDLPSPLLFSSCSPLKCK